MTTYFVKTGGSDVASGLSDALAWGTLAKVSATTFQAGDIVSFNRGNVWQEQMSIKGTGTAGNPLTYTAYGTGARPIFSAADTPAFVFDTTVAGGDRYTIATLGWTTSYLFREDGTIGTGTVTNLTKDAALPTALGHWWQTGTTLYVVVATGEVPQAGGVNIHVGRRNFCINEAIDGQAYITLDNLHLRFNNDGSTFGQIHAAGNSVVNTNWTISNLLVEWGGIGMKFGGQGTNSFAQTRVLTVTDSVFRYNRTHGAQLIFLSAGSAVTRCDFYSNGNSGLGIAMRNGTVTGCTFHHNANVSTKWTAPNGVQGFDHGLYVVGQVPNFDRAFGNVISGCVAYSNAKAGLSVDALSGPHTFQRCVSYSNTLYGIMLEGGTTNGSSGNKVYNCTFWNNAKSAIHVINNHGPFDARNNQFFHNGRDGSQDLYIEWNISTWALHSGTSGVDAIYKHQHMDWVPTAMSQDDQTVLTGVASVGAMTAGTWFYDAPAETLYVRKTGSTAPTTCWADTTYTLNYNNYTTTADRPAGHAIYRITHAGAGNTFYSALSALQAGQSGVEVNGIQADPLYTDTSIPDFTLLPGSPARDVGAVLAGVTTGYFGASPDLGAFESIVTSLMRRRRR